MAESKDGRIKNKWVAEALGGEGIYVLSHGALQLSARGVDVAPARAAHKCRDTRLDE
jgi:hypothetical protein